MPTMNTYTFSVIGTPDARKPVYLETATHKYGGTYAREVEIRSDAFAHAVLWSWEKRRWRFRKALVSRSQLVPLAASAALRGETP